MSGGVRFDTWSGEHIAYAVNVSELLHALGAREGGVDVHRRVGLLHCDGLAAEEGGSTCSAENLRRLKPLRRLSTLLAYTKASKLPCRMGPPSECS